MREWLRLLADRGVDPNQLEGAAGAGRQLRSLVARTLQQQACAQRQYDFSHEVKEAMSGCLACKSPVRQCPIKIDVPEFRSRFLQLYHSRYLRPVRDSSAVSRSSVAPLMAQAPEPFNFY